MDAQETSILKGMQSYHGEVDGNQNDQRSFRARFSPLLQQSNSELH